MKKKSQTDRILAYLLKGNSITALSALTKFGCLRLASRISEIKTREIRLEKHNIYRDSIRTVVLNIESKWVTHKGKRYKKYWLA